MKPKDEVRRVSQRISKSWKVRICAGKDPSTAAKCAAKGCDMMSVTRFVHMNYDCGEAAFNSESLDNLSLNGPKFSFVLVHSKSGRMDYVTVDG